MKKRKLLKSSNKWDKLVPSGVKNKTGGNWDAEDSDVDDDQDIVGFGV